MNILNQDFWAHWLNSEPVFLPRIPSLSFSDSCLLEATHTQYCTVFRGAKLCIRHNRESGTVHSSKA
jgi:hypothetical protein